MKVADSSYLIQGILRDASLLANETFVSPDLALYEVINALWKHETLIKDLKESSARISLFLELVSAETVQLVIPDKKLLEETYSLSRKHRVPTYDMVFVALALELSLELKTYDSRQTTIISKETQT
jgi:predicted nucleic acid-binding protein